MIVLDSGYDLEGAADAIAENIDDAELGTVFLDSIGLEWTLVSSTRSGVNRIYLLAAGLTCPVGTKALTIEGGNRLNLNVTNHAQIRIEVSPLDDGGVFLRSQLFLPLSEPVLFT